MIVVGVTGAIAAGKSALMKALAEFGAAAFDADAEVWDFYRGDGRGPLAALFPGAFADGELDRTRLSALALADRQALSALEALAHPAVAARRGDFLAKARAKGVRVAALEIPLLFETGGERSVDVVLVVDALEALRRERAMARPGMDEGKLDAIFRRQGPASEKRRRAHFVIDASGPLAAARSQARDFLRALAHCEGGGADHA